MALGRWQLIVAALAFGPCSYAAAADIDQSPPTPPIVAKASAGEPDWVVTIGAEVRADPAWPGAPTTLYMPGGYPLFNIRKPGDPPFFFGARDGFGAPLLDVGPWQFGPVGTINWPRYSSQYAQLRGLGDVGWSVEVGGYVQYWPTSWLRIRGELRQGVGSETGQTGNLYIDGVVPVGQFRLSGGPRLTVQSASALSPYFGITPGQAATSGVAGFAPLTPYNVDGGVYSYGGGGQAEYFFDPQWQVHGIFEYERITGSAANSPLVTMRGSPNQYTFGAGATYTFNMRPLFHFGSLF
jgi:outer membrane protein